MIIENKEQIDKYLEYLPDEYLNDVLAYLRFLSFKNKQENIEVSSMLLSEQSLAKEWLTPKEDEAWQHL